MLKTGALVMFLGIGWLVMAPAARAQYTYVCTSRCVRRSGPRAGLSLLVAMAVLSAPCVDQASPAWAQATATGRGAHRPAYQSLRFDEDWSSLKGVDRSATDDIWDRVKFMPLTADASVWLSVAGQIRERVEYFRHFLFGASKPRDTDAYLLSRVRLSADLHLTPSLRVFVEEKSAFAMDRELAGGRTSTYVEEFALQNAFADIVLLLGEAARLTLRGGRQELIFGAQRLVGEPDFGQARRTFDGGQGILAIGDWTISALWTQAVVPEKYEFNGSTSDLRLFGIYATGPAHLLPVRLDFYWLGVDNALAAFNGTAGRERRHTLGGRAWGPIGRTGLDFEVEGAAQLGTVGRESIAASMLTAVLGYALPVRSLSARVYVSVDYASGDDKPGGRVGTFNQLYPAAHSFLGYIDYIGRQNIVSPSVGLAMTPISDLTLTLQQYVFWRASNRDALYNKSGAILRPGTGTTERYVGAELDLLATYNVTRHWLATAGYSHFFPGAFLTKTGPSEPSNFFYWSLQYTF